MIQILRIGKIGIKGDVRRLMLNKRQIEQLARNSSIKGIRYYMQRVHEDVDILSGEEKRQILEEMERIIEEIKDKRNKEDINRYIGDR